MAVVRALRASRVAGLRRADVRFGSKADIGAPPVDVRFTPESGHAGSASRANVVSRALAEVAAMAHAYQR